MESFTIYDTIISLKYSLLAFTERTRIETVLQETFS